MKNILALITSLFVLSSCGFEPVYAKRENNKSILIGSSFEIKKIDAGQPGQKLQYELEDLLNHGKSGEKKYRLVTVLNKTKEGIGIQKDRYITRYNIRALATYEVFDITSGKKIFGGASMMVGGFNTVVSEFGTYSLEENTMMSLMDELAKDIVMAISTKLSDTKSIDKLAEEQKEIDQMKKDNKILEINDPKAISDRNSSAR